MTTRIKAADLPALLANPKGKQRVEGAQRTTVDGIEFASRKEARRWQELRLLERAGHIYALERQVPIELDGKDDYVRTAKTGRPMRYIADFRYIDRRMGSVPVIEDVKSGPHTTEVYAIKRAILAAMGIRIKEV